MLTPIQIRMARAALGWSVHDLAAKAGITGNTVSRFENGREAKVATLTQIERALEDAGIIFLPEDETGGPGVRLKKDAVKRS